MTPIYSPAASPIRTKRKAAIELQALRDDLAKLGFVRNNAR